MTSRGCPRGCAFCVVGCKEGITAKRVADPKDFYEGQERIHILDANILAVPDKHKLLREYSELGCFMDFNQGLDIRLIDDEDIDILNGMRFKHGSDIHFAWDNPNEDLTDQLKMFSDKFRLKDKGSVYILTNFGSTIEQDLFRIRKTFELGYSPYVMIYNKPNAPRELRLLQRWCNNKYIFKSVKFEDYDPRRA